MTDLSENKVSKLDAQLVAIARGIKILNVLNWKPEIRDSFLANWKAGNPKLPEPAYQLKSLEQEKTGLSSIISSVDGNNPLESFLKVTAQSYLDAALMLEGIGTPEFLKYSKKIYGSPADNILSTDYSHFDLAQRLIETTGSFINSCHIDDADICILPETVQAELQLLCNLVFVDHPVRIELDPDLASKAAAGAERVRIRSNTCFSDADVGQLAEHECLVHTLTAINGSEQRELKSLGLSAPRTTRTQEGLAIFSELVTRKMDLNRLRRIALRVIGVQMALDGADFIEVFKYFLEKGQSEQESYQSTYRVFRGGDVTGKVAFTKDAVYLAGLTEVHTFLVKSIQEEKLLYPSYLFAGRLTLKDINALEESFKSGLLSMPTYEPEWISNRPTLLTFLLYSSFSSYVDLDSIALADFTA